MPDKWKRIKSGDERDSQSFDETYRLKKVGPFGWSGSAMVQVRVNSSGEIVTTSGAGIPTWDYAALTQAATTDTWTFKTGGSGVTTVRTVVVTYTDSTKATISNVAIT